MKTIVPFSKEIKLDATIYEITSISLEHEIHLRDNVLCGDFIVSGDYKTHELSINKDPFSYRLPFEVELFDNVDPNTVNFDIVDFNYDLVRDEALNVHIEFCVEAEAKEEIAEEVVVEAEEIKEEIEPIEEERTIEEEPILEERTFEEEIIDKESEEMIEEKLNEEIDLFTEPLEEIETIEEIIDSNELEIENEIIDTNEPEIKEIIDINEPEIDKEIENEIINRDELRLDKETENEIINTIISGEDKYVTYNVHIVKEGETIESICALYDVEIDLIKQYNDITDILPSDKLLIPNEVNE